MSAREGRMRVYAVSWHDAWDGYQVAYYATRAEQREALRVMRHREKHDKDEFGHAAIMLVTGYDCEYEPTRVGVVNLLNRERI